MGTFGGFTRLRSGYWMGIRSWLLNESIDIPKRIAHIQRERERIGRVSVEYETKDNGDGNLIATEKRISFSVTTNSSLEKLIKSYIVMGGNPMDISMFMYPNTTEIVGVGADDVGTDHLKRQEYPYDGKVSPINRSDNESSIYERSKIDQEGVAYSFGSDSGGGLNVKKYQPPRVGKGARLIWTAEHTTQSAVMHDLRNWANQEIAEKLHLLEHKILKLCDLEEQLENELEVLTKAFGKSIEELFPYYDDELDEASKDELLGGSGASLRQVSANADRFFLKNTVQWLIYDMDKVFFETDAAGGIVMLESIDNMLEVIWAYPDYESESVLDFCL